MAAKKPSTPKLDPSKTNETNLRVLRRDDPDIDEVLGSASHVTLYSFDLDSRQWMRKNVEGSLFVVKRRSLPRFQFIVLNRLASEVTGKCENCVEDLLGEFEFELSPPYLLYRSQNEVNGIWFYRQPECDEITALFNRITSAYGKTPTRPEELANGIVVAPPAAPATQNHQHPQHVRVATSTSSGLLEDHHQRPQHPTVDTVAALFKAASVSGQGRSIAPPPPPPPPQQQQQRQQQVQQHTSNSNRSGGVGLSRDAVREAMIRLVSDDQFIDMITASLNK